MFFLLSKILNILLMPYFWVFIFLFMSYFGSPKFKKHFRIIGFSLLYIFSTELFVYPILKCWEYPSIWYKDITNDYDAAIVLGGMASPGKLPDDRTHFAGSPDRLMHALQLYKLGKVKKIIISGGSGQVTGEQIPEADFLKNELLLCNVNERDILFENKSRNTRENALYTKELLGIHFASGAKCILVTSAWHMRRSVACYEKVGINALPFSVDSQVPQEITFWGMLIPSPFAMMKWQAIIHELFGYSTYKIAGYI